MSALHARCIVVSDTPTCFPYGLHDHDEMVRVFEPFIARGFSDREAWAALFDDAHNIEVAASVWKKWLQRPKRTKAKVVSLFDVVEARL